MGFTLLEWLFWCVFARADLLGLDSGVWFGILGININFQPFLFIPPPPVAPKVTRNSKLRDRGRAIFIFTPSPLCPLAFYCNFVI